MLKYSFVILCHNNSELTKQAVETLIASFDDSIINDGIEIVIIDNGSIDNTQDVISELIKKYSTKNIETVNVKLVENMGYPVGVNIGLSYCRGEIIGVLNNDLIFPTNWFNGIVQLLNSDESIGFVAPYLSYASGIQNKSTQLNSIDEINKFNMNFINENKDSISYVTRVIGACIILRKQVLEKIGGNDFFYGLGHFDDDDWCLRARIAGYKIAVTGNSFVYHIGSKTFNSMKCNMNHFVRINRNKFHNKWQLIRDGQSNSVYLNRENYIKEHEYSREEHFIPYKLNVVKKDNNNAKINKILLVANWDNTCSRWKEKLFQITDILKDNEEVYVWVPNRYFNYHLIVNTIKNVMKRRSNIDKLKFIGDYVNHIDIVDFVGKYTTVINVKNDFINRYIVYIANKLEINIY